MIVLLSDVPVLAAVLAAVAFYGTYSKPLKVFSVYIFFSGFIQFVSLLFWMAGKNNMPVLHVYVALALPCLVWFYQTVLAKVINRSIFIGIAGIFAVFTLINSLFFQDLFRFNSNALVVMSMLLIILALFTFVFLLNDTVRETHIPDRKSLGWINSGLFIYHLSCLLIFFFGDTIIFRFSLALSRFTWAFHALFSIIMYTCFFIGLWKRSKKKLSFMHS